MRGGGGGGGGGNLDELLVTVSLLMVVIRHCTGVRCFENPFEEIIGMCDSMMSSTHYSPIQI